MSTDLTKWDSDPALTKHITLIRKRAECINATMGVLARQLFTLSLYLKRTSVTVENCKFAIDLQVGEGELGVKFTLKGGRRDPDKVDWRDLVDGVIKSKEVGKVISSLREHRSCKPAVIGGFNVTKAWEVIRSDLGREYIRLLPAAKILVEAELTKQAQRAEEDIAYLESVDELLEP